MALQVFFRLLKQHLLWFFLLPCVTVGAVYFFTQNETSVYQSEATLYTGFASGYTILTDQQIGAMDRSAVAFDNLLTTLKSRETMHQIGVNLLAQQLHAQRPDNQNVTPASFNLLQRVVPAPLRQSLLNGANENQLRLRLDSMARLERENPIKTLLYNPDYNYSVALITKNLKATRRNTSDMLDMEYESGDPAIAQQTLVQAIDVLNKRYTALKRSETDSVVTYYQTKTQQAKKRLDGVEARLQAFNTNNNVLNFEEESKNITLSGENLNNEYNQELMQNRATKAALDALSRRMGQAGNILNVNNELRAKQAELTNIETQLANAQAYGQPRNVVVRLQEKAIRISEDLREGARKYYNANNTTDAISQQTILDEWLTKMIELEESNARLEVYKGLQKDYSSKTNQYTPLESQLRQLNRDLSVAEKEYLALNQSLNQALARRQDTSVDGPLSILDAPDFPSEPQASKRWLFMAIGAGLGLVIALLLTAIRFWLDRRIASPEHAEMLIGRPLTALFPRVKKFSIDSKAGRTALSMFEQLCSAVNIEIVQSTGFRPLPPIISVFSMRSQQGKTWITNGLARLYAETGQQVAFCYPRTDDSQQKVEQDGITFFPYTLRPDFMNITQLENLLDQEHYFDSHQYEKIFFELPPLISSSIPVYLMNQSSVSILVTDANSIWARTENQLLSMYLKVVNHPVLTVLNSVTDNYFDAPSRADTSQGPVQPERSLELQRTLRSLEQQQKMNYGKIS
ncbi:GumC family protein [Tellurirhabdus bombi]|uniref:GumC family protein n=1 Tax=Tellurirhabdus bombi TaxID=2907205 RepID=UPI001F3F99CF|nr:lipopolysaccharide biosynthesis protein [Tellurirhabdus bombi]